MDTQILKHGQLARLFPVLPDSQKEQKTLSIFLAAITSVKPLAERCLAIVDQKIGKRTDVKCFTEVTLTNEIKGFKDRPDALLVVKSGKRSWSALIEAKTGKNLLDSDQIERYLQLAKVNGVDAVITISNQLTPSPRIHPIWSRALPKNLELFHISWAAILTQAFLLIASKTDPFENDDEAFITSEFIRYLEHPMSGVLPLSQMNKEWPDLVKAVQSGHPPNPKTPEVASMVAMWHQEARDVALILTRRLHEPVTIAVSRAFLTNHSAWVESEIKQFCSKKVLTFQLDIPNAADRLNVEADFLRRSIRVSMKLSAPGDKSRNSARLNWLLRQLKSADLSKISILCKTKGRGSGFGAMAHELNPETDEFKALGEITSFTVEIASDLSAKFNSRKKFVEELELIVPQFYETVGQNLKAWVAPPPKVRQPKSADDKNPDSVNQKDQLSGQDLSDGSSAPNSDATEAERTRPRPEWTQQWSIEPATLRLESKAKL